jgi:hypothetical protein
MPLNDRWYLHPNNCKCSECRLHKEKNIQKKKKNNNSVFSSVIFDNVIIPTYCRQCGSNELNMVTGICAHCGWTEKPNPNKKPFTPEHHGWIPGVEIKNNKKSNRGGSK